MWAKQWLCMCLFLASPATLPQQAAAPFDHEHRQFADVLKSVVRDGRVDYRALQRDRRLLDRYRQQLAAVSAATISAASREQQMAFWINAYNAGILATIVEHYPLSRGSLVGLAFPANSIWQISGAFKASRHTVAGQTRSLDSIEHNILRPDFRDPRVHMALVCAARGCPPLRAEPFVGARLGRQLDDQARIFLGDRVHGLNWAPANRRLAISSIFKWFAEDFAPAGGVREFVARYAVDPSLAAAVRDPANKIRYLDYDWTLNEP